MFLKPSLGSWNGFTESLLQAVTLRPPFPSSFLEAAFGQSQLKATDGGKESHSEEGGGSVTANFAKQLTFNTLSFKKSVHWSLKHRNCVKYVNLKLTASWTFKVWIYSWTSRRETSPAARKVSYDPQHLAAPHPGPANSATQKPPFWQPPPQQVCAVFLNLTGTGSRSSEHSSAWLPLLLVTPVTALAFIRIRFCYFWKQSCSAFTHLISPHGATSQIKIKILCEKETSENCSPKTVIWQFRVSIT